MFSELITGMFAQVHQPSRLRPEELDAYLERGWFRMGQNIFTTNFLHFKTQFYSAMWLRVALDQFSEDATQKKLFRQNEVFRTEIGPATLTSEKEELYARYRQQLPFEPSVSLNQLLFGKTATTSIYNTSEVAVYDGDKLIAIGFFDKGDKSAAGITSVYDHDYKKYSLGKYLIYRKIDHCKKQMLRYFYPGYFAPGYPSFDYKLAIGKPAVQFLQLQSGEWLNAELFTTDNVPIRVMQDKLNTIVKLLALAGLESKVAKYEFFDANLIPELKDAGLFDFPLILYFPGHSDTNLDPVVVFDVRDACYHILRCIPVWTPNTPNNDPEFYADHLIMTEENILSTTDAEEAVGVLLSSMNL